MTRIRFQQSLDDLKENLSVASVALGAIAPGGPTYGVITVLRSGRAFSEERRDGRQREVLFRPGRIRFLQELAYNLIY